MIFNATGEQQACGNVFYPIFLRVQWSDLVQSEGVGCPNNELLINDQFLNQIPCFISPVTSIHIGWGDSNTELSFVNKSEWEWAPQNFWQNTGLSASTPCFHAHGWGWRQGWTQQRTGCLHSNVRHHVRKGLQRTQQTYQRSMNSLGHSKPSFFTLTQEPKP